MEFRARETVVLLQSNVFGAECWWPGRGEISHWIDQDDRGRKWVQFPHLPSPGFPERKERTKEFFPVRKKNRHRNAVVSGREQGKR